MDMLYPTGPRHRLLRRRYFPCITSGHHTAEKTSYSESIRRVQTLWNLASSESQTRLQRAFCDYIILLLYSTRWWKLLSHYCWQLAPLATLLPLSPTATMLSRLRPRLLTVPSRRVSIMAKFLTERNPESTAELSTPTRIGSSTDPPIDSSRTLWAPQSLEFTRCVLFHPEFEFPEWSFYLELASHPNRFRCFQLFLLTISLPYFARFVLFWIHLSLPIPCLQNVGREVLVVTLIATFAMLWNMLTGEYTDLVGEVHPGMLRGQYTPVLALPMNPFTLSSSFLGLLLVFRTNKAYQRWDEARKNWGMNM